MTPNDPRAYLRRVLALDPVEDVDTILAARDEWLGLAPTPASTKGEDRDSVRHALENLRLELGDGSVPDDALERLDAIDTTRYPDLDRLARRFRTLITHRGLFEELEERRGGGFVPYVWEVLVAPTAESLEFRDAAHRALRFDQRTIPDLRHAASVARRIRASAPEVYALQPDWFDFL
ncbi:MAG: hypothetical protein KDC38_07215, partial [Planctomycetes bacterium]|nr:hypothetical protein [Planctomycetota bacterium]